MASKKYIVNLDLNKNELQNAVEHNLATAPSSPKEGQKYYNTADHLLYVWNGTSWINALSQGTGTVTSVGVSNGTDGGLSVSGSPITGSGTITVGHSNVLASAQATEAVYPITFDKNGHISSAGSAQTILALASDVEASTGTNETKAINPKQLKSVVDTAIASAIAGGLIYKGTWDSTSQTDFSSITAPVKKGWMYLVTGTGATINSINYNSGDYIVLNADVASGVIPNANIDKIDNTESSDIVRTSVTQTLTNKTIDADDNTISDLEVDNFKSGVIVDCIRPSNDAENPATDTSIPTELAVALEVERLRSNVNYAIGMATLKSVNNPELIPTGGVCTWNVGNVQGEMSSEAIARVYENATDTEVYAEIIINHTTHILTIKINSSSTIAADTYKVVINCEHITFS